MFNLEKYSRVLHVIEDEIKANDSQTAHNIAKEVSVIYLKYTYGVHMPGVIPRLESLIDYTKKTLSNPDNIVSELTDVKLIFADLLK